jgi:hypothetical protein
VRAAKRGTFARSTAAESSRWSNDARGLIADKLASPAGVPAGIPRPWDALWRRRNAHILGNESAESRRGNRFFVVFGPRKKGSFFNHDPNVSQFIETTQVKTKNQPI